MMKKIFKPIIYAAIFCLVFGVSAYLTLSFIIGTEKTVVIPDLVGKDIVYALEMLTDLGVNIKVKGSAYSDRVPKNHVISQRPEPGAVIKEGRDVHLVFSKGEEQLIMPNLMGLPVPQAEIILEENTLEKHVVSETYHDHIGARAIVAQYPPSGMHVNRNTHVNLLVSKGQRPAMFVMPDFTGMGLEAAILKIEEKGLVPGVIHTVYKPDVPQNVVIDQEPLFGGPVEIKTRVNLVINRKADEKNRPIDLKGIHGVRLFHYKTGFGFLKKHIRVEMNVFNNAIRVVDGFIGPGETIWVIVPNQTDVTLILYENNELVKTEIYDAW